MQQGRHEEAIPFFERAIAMSPAVPAYHNNLGETYRRVGKLEQAIECYGRAIALKRDYPPGYSNRAIALLQQERFASLHHYFPKPVRSASPVYQICDLTMLRPSERTGKAASLANVSACAGVYGSLGLLLFWRAARRLRKDLF